MKGGVGGEGRCFRPRISFSSGGRDARRAERADARRFASQIFTAGSSGAGRASVSQRLLLRAPPAERVAPQLKMEYPNFGEPSASASGTRSSSVAQSTC